MQEPASPAFVPCLGTCQRLVREVTMRRLLLE